MSKNISQFPIGNLFSERQSLIVTRRDGANYYNKVLIPFAEYILNSQDTSDYKNVDSALMKKIHENYYDNRGDLEERHRIFWKNASSLPRILPIVYFERVGSKEYLRITEVGKKHYEGKLTCKEFLLLWILRFQGSEYSDKGVLTKSKLSILSSCKHHSYRSLVETRIVKPGILALDVLKKAKENGVDEITDKQFRNARKLLNQEDEQAVSDITQMVISGESSDGSQENQIFNVLEYLGLCNVKSYQTNNYKFEITGLGAELINKIKSLPFTYYHKTNMTSDFIEYYGGMPNKFENEIMDYYRLNGGDFNV